MQQRPSKRTVEGLIVSTKMDKTVVVSCERRFVHKKYGKTVRKTSRFSAHDAENKCKEGDIVLITEIRPISKTKRWRVEKILGSKGLYKENDTSSVEA